MLKRDVEFNQRRPGNGDSHLMLNEGADTDAENQAENFLRVAREAF